MLKESDGFVREYAEDSVNRYLRFVAGRSRRPWDWDSRRWECDEDGNWYTWVLKLDPSQMKRNGRSPDLIISEDAVSRFGKAREARETAASEIKDALRGQEQVLEHNADGSERVDFKANIRNKDGTLNRAGKALIEIHQRTARYEQAATDALREGKQ